jgi:hypothetical protein
VPLDLNQAQTDFTSSANKESAPSLLLPNNDHIVQLEVQSVALSTKANDFILDPEAEEEV